MNEHSMVLRLPTGDPIPHDPPGTPIWREQVPHHPDHPLAQRLCHREATRALAPTGPRVRVTMLAYADGATDLVIVADRSALDHAGLCRLAGTLAGQPLPGSGFAVVAPTTQSPAETPEWGLGEASSSRTGERPIDPARMARWTTSTVTSAVTSVLARYRGEAKTGDGPATVDKQATAGRQATADEQATVDGAIAGVRPAVGLVFAPAVPGLRYRPCLSPLFPLTVFLTVDGDRPVSGTYWFDESLIHPRIAEQFVRHVGNVADQLAAAGPGLDPDAAGLLRPDEIAAVLATGRSSAPAGGRTDLIHEAFQAVADRHGQRPAISDEHRVLTYRQLDRMAQRYADGLRALGVAQGDFVGVCVDRTVELVAIMLGVLKAGAAYIPLNGHDPADRLRYIVADAGLRLVVSDQFPAMDGVRVAAPALLAATRTANLPDPSAPSRSASDRSAYVIYTSGSTGRPKGVVVPHRNVSALVAATAPDLDLSPYDVWTLFHSAAFDFSVWEVWGCLLTGGRLVVVPYLVTRSPAEFYELLAAERVTVLNQTPSAFANLQQVDAGRAAELALRLVVFGGEPLDPRSLRGWVDRHPHHACRLVNMFGITETTVHVTATTITPSDVRAGSRSVGRPLPGWSVSVRDPHGSVLPLGVAGEIYVGGAGVATGYLNRPDLTAARFLRGSDGGGTEPDGGRMYRSGDRGRLRPDGTLDHLGRLDNQVKVRGFRIELDEIRSVLLADDAVEGAAVIVAGDDGDPASTRIHAFVVTKRVTQTASIRKRVAQMLPDYMVPATVTAVARLPLTSNGKLDVAALPVPRSAPPREAGGGGLSDVVTGIWRQVLGLPAAPGEDFFEQGGNSLLAVRLVTALHDAGLPAVSIRELYRNRTIDRLSALLESRAQVTAGQP